MATTAKMARDLKLEVIRRESKALQAQKKPGIAKLPGRHRNRCWRCGRPRAFLR
jgi:ribosomal protein S14